MRNLWLIPDREQEGEISVLEGEKISLLHETLPLKKLPPALSFGIPKELLLKNLSNNFIYAQFGRLKNGQNIFARSIRAGQDRSGRTVTLTELQILEKGESPKISVQVNANASDELQHFMLKMKNILSDPDNISRKKIDEMLNATKREQRPVTFSSELLTESVNKPDWTPRKKKIINNTLMIVLAVLLISLVIFLIYLFTQQKAAII